MARKTGLSRTLASCTHRRANTPFGKIRPQKGTLKGMGVLRMTFWMLRKAKITHIVHIDQRTKQIDVQTTSIDSPVGMPRSSSESPL